ITIPAERAFAVINMNKKGNKSMSLEADSKPQPTNRRDAQDILAQDSVTRFDSTIKKKKKKRTSPKNKNQENTPAAINNTGNNNNQPKINKPQQRPVNENGQLQENRNKGGGQPQKNNRPYNKKKQKRNPENPQQPRHRNVKPNE
ncbi:MAG: hypothetical protein LIP01_02905, partial [Tannerellaceae bacterium]|nr:hypothetical protein [Tannerellaceae bacterium]